MPRSWPAIGSPNPARARRHLEAALRSDPGYAPAARALAPLLAEAGEWQRLAEALDNTARWERDPLERVRVLERLAEVQQDKLSRPRDALRTLARALAVDPGRASVRKAMEGAAARADAFLELTRAYRAAARSDGVDLKARKTLLRRVAEVLDHDLGQPEEAVRAWRSLSELDPEDKGAAASLEAAMARAGQEEELARSLEEKRAHASGEERAALSSKLARLWAEAGETDRAAGLWREVLTSRSDDEEALWGLHAALEAQPGARSAEERVRLLARLALKRKGHPERAALELARAELLADPLGRLGESAGIALSLVAGGGLVASQQAEAVELLERLLARGVDPVANGAGAGTGLCRRRRDRQAGGHAGAGGAPPAAGGRSPGTGPLPARRLLAPCRAALPIHGVRSPMRRPRCGLARTMPRRGAAARSLPGGWARSGSSSPSSPRWRARWERVPRRRRSCEPGPPRWPRRTWGPSTTPRRSSHAR